MHNITQLETASTYRKLTHALTAIRYLASDIHWWSQNPESWPLPFICSCTQLNISSHAWYFLSSARRNCTNSCQWIPLLSDIQWNNEEEPHDIFKWFGRTRIWWTGRLGLFAWILRQHIHPLHRLIKLKDNANHLQRSFTMLSREHGSVYSSEGLL